MPHHFEVIWGRASREVRRLERQLRKAHGGNRAYTWGLPAAALVLCFTILVVAGIYSGASAAEFVPIAIFEGLVIAGLFVACMLPAASPPDDRGDRGPDPDPDPTPPPLDPDVWVRLLADSNVTAQPPGGVDAPAPRELTGATR
ncbi:MAG TPA: hypothetical protein VND54_02305 [Candidatus Saccharimonadales bacterium]|nr:hypothetical protein [Candidatus Saccharimonadales bacterium]